MFILPLHSEIILYLREHKLEKKFLEKIKFLENNFSHPSLNTEILKPKHLRIYSFRVDKKYRAIFIFRNSQTIEILDINNHHK